MPPLIVFQLAFWWAYLLTFGLPWGALSTYRYFLPKPKDYQWWHYSLHGFMVSLAAIPYAYVSGHWMGLWIRCVICAILVGAWSHFIGWDDLEEGGRGTILTGTAVFLK